jgi:hypothetical protein
MSVIEASSVQIRTMADGTLRIVCDVEPRHAQSAFRLFGSPGTPMALAGLKPAPAEPERPKGGPLSQWAAMRGADPEFRRWLAQKYNTQCPNEGAAASILRLVCEVESRADLDNDTIAAARFHERIMGPWQKHCIATGVTA